MDLMSFVNNPIIVLLRRGVRLAAAAGDRHFSRRAKQAAGSFGAETKGGPFAPLRGRRRPGTRSMHGVAEAVPPGGREHLAIRRG
jgi:hypothetical protein